MHFTEAIPLVAAIINGLLTIFVLSKDLRRGLNQVYALWGISLTVWNLGTFMMFRVDEHDAALFWARILQCGVIWLPVSLAHLCLLVAQIHRPKLIKFFYWFHAVLLGTNMTPLFVQDVKDLGYAWYSVAGPFFWVFVATYALPIYTVVLLLKKRKTLPALHRTRITYMSLAVGLLICFGSNDTLPILGIHEYPMTGIRILPFGSLAAIFYGIIVSYSVLQHQLLGIHVVLGRLSAHIVRLGFLLAVSVALLLTISVTLPGSGLTVLGVIAATAAFAVSATLATILFPKIFRQGEDDLVRRILGDRFEYHDQIRGFIQMLPHWRNEGELLDQLELLLAKTIHVQSFYVLIKAPQGTRFHLARAYPKPVEMPEVSDATPALDYFRKTNVSHLAFNIAYAMPGQDPDEQAVHKLFSNAEAEFCFPMRVGEDLLALCFLGEKSADDPYTRHDLILLVELFEALGACLGQLRLRERLLFQEEMELMGRMSRGLAHDLNNLVTPVSTFLQLVREQNGSADGLEELLPVALRNIQTIRAYIKEALMFSNTHSLQLVRTRLDQVIRDATALAHAKLQAKNIRVELDLQTDVPVEIDAVLIQRVIDNLISNAADASAPESIIRITSKPLTRSEAHREWYRIEVIDQGEGISKENQKRIFTPYFTTKDKGDKTRGFGLGLAICRKIVHLHGGNLSVRSELGKGTTVQLDLPSAQQSQPAFKRQEVAA